MEGAGYTSALEREGQVGLGATWLHSPGLAQWPLGQAVSFSQVKEGKRGDYNRKLLAIHMVTGY